MTKIKLTLVILCLLLAGCKRVECKWEVEYTGPAVNSTLQESGSTYTLTEVCK